MFRLTFGVLLFACSTGLAQVAQPTRGSYNEPPIAEPGEFKPAPPETTVIPGQPRTVPSLDSPDAPRATVPANTSPSGIQPVQYVTPSGVQPGQNVMPSYQQQAPPRNQGGQQQTPTVLYAEPPAPTVRISVKGLGTAPTNQELTYQIAVTNASDQRAFNVIARCTVPRGTKLVKSLPAAKVSEKDLEWYLETLEPGDTRRIEVSLMPGPDTTDVTFVGRVQFEHGQMVKTKLAKPELEMKKTGPAEGVLTHPMTYRIIVTNPGAVPVTDIQIVDTLPQGLEYVQETSNGAMPVSKIGPAPNQRTWTLGSMYPKESRTIEYRVMPRTLGDWTSEAVVTGTGVFEKAGCNTHVHEARITLQVDGPLNEKGVANQSTPYLIHVHNTGTAILHNVRVFCQIPNEIRLSKISNGGHLYKDGVQWLITSLQPNETKDISMNLTAPTPGLRDFVFSARGDKGLEQRKKITTAFEGVPALNWQTEGTPVSAPGKDVIYTITVTNPGSAPVKNVKIIADLSELVDFQKAEPAFDRGQGAVYFKPVDIQPKQSVVCKVFTTAKKPGEARFQFEMTAEGMSTGAFKHSKATTISPTAGPLEVDPSRIGTAPAGAPVEPKREPRKLVPASGIGTAEPIASSADRPPMMPPKIDNHTPAVPSPEVKTPIAPPLLVLPKETPPIVKPMVPKKDKPVEPKQAAPAPGIKPPPQSAPSAEPPPARLPEPDLDIKAPDVLPPNPKP